MRPILFVMFVCAAVGAALCSAACRGTGQQEGRAGGDVARDDESEAPDAEAALRDLPPEATEALDSLPDPALGFPCSGDAACSGGVCLDGTCTRSCEGDCPTGWRCRSAEEEGIEGGSVCVPEPNMLCAPCEGDDGCGAATACFNFWPPGSVWREPRSVCLRQCTGWESPCADGFECEPQLKSGRWRWACVPPEGGCCSELTEGSAESCTFRNKYGECPGVRECLGAEGWSYCRRAAGLEERCNGRDDDCDGGIDEGTDLGDCDDGDHCNGSESCKAGVCVPGAPVDCGRLDDGCGHGVCDPADGSCRWVPVYEGHPCDDLDACTEPDACHAGSCVSGPPVGCEDGDPCTFDLCSPDVGCVRLLAREGTPCDDGRRCTVGDACLFGVCLGGAEISCDDDDPCTDDECREDRGCVYTWSAAPCDDGDPCTAGDRCWGGACRGWGPACPGDGDRCRGLGSCDAVGGCFSGTRVDCGALRTSCVRAFCDRATGACETVPVDDLTPCDEGAVCKGGLCVFVPETQTEDPLECALDEDCDDGNVCNVERCLPGDFLADEEGNLVLEDGDIVPTGKRCRYAGGADPNCCMKDSDCYDRNPCNRERCDLSVNQCIITVSTTGYCCIRSSDCNDSDESTADFCHDYQCRNVPFPNYCDHSGNHPCEPDVHQCTTEACVNRSCRHESIPNCCVLDEDCDDRDACTDDVCVEGRCRHVERQPCCENDSDCFNLDDCLVGRCEEGSCVFLSDPALPQPCCISSLIWQPLFQPDGLPEDFSLEAPRWWMEIPWRESPDGTEWRPSSRHGPSGTASLLAGASGVGGPPAWSILYSSVVQLPPQPGFELVLWVLEETVSPRGVLDGVGRLRISVLHEDRDLAPLLRPGEDVLLLDTDPVSGTHLNPYLGATQTGTWNELVFRGFDDLAGLRVRLRITLNTTFHDALPGLRLYLADMAVRTVCPPVFTCTGDAECDDEAYCTLDLCSVAGVCRHLPRPCDDGDPETADSCTEELGCRHGPIEEPERWCALDAECVGALGPCFEAMCHASTGTCVSAGAVSCDDGDVCTSDTCHPERGCEHTTDHAHCPPCAEDSDCAAWDDPCNLYSCDPSAGVCRRDASPLDDGDPCTEGVCDREHGVVRHLPIADCFTRPCAKDGDCGAPTACASWRCLPTTPGGASRSACLLDRLSCDDGDPCTAGSCDDASGKCSFAPAGCDDGDVCTFDDCDSAEGCVHVRVLCLDADLCTEDACDPATGACSSSRRDCDDGDLCTDDHCDPKTGACVQTRRLCADGVDCVYDVCRSEAGDCKHVPSCDATDPCATMPCDDGDPCTADSCEAGVGCRHSPSPELCEEGGEEGCEVAPGQCCESDAWEPVCGLDGRTYRNRCALRCAQTELGYAGHCACFECPVEGEPVWGPDGQQYPNACVATKCEGVSRDELRPGPSACEHCPKIFEPVCAFDRTTYANACVAACRRLPVLHEGPCAACACVAGCEEPAPVCSEGVTWPNAAFVEAAACRREDARRVERKGACVACAEGADCEDPGKWSPVPGCRECLPELDEPCDDSLGCAADGREQTGVCRRYMPAELCPAPCGDDDDCDDGDLCTVDRCNEGWCQVGRAPNCTTCEDDRECGRDEACYLSKRCGEIPGDVFTSPPGEVHIDTRPDNSGVESTITVPSNTPGALEGPYVKLDLSHDRVGEVEIELRHAGRSITLKEAGSEDCRTGWHFTYDLGADVADGSMSLFYGQPIEGSWDLVISDKAPGSNGGVLRGWALYGSYCAFCSTDADCNDNSSCTDEACVAGHCVSKTTACKDEVQPGVENKCTFDSCEPDVGCVFTPKSCDDGVECTTDTCLGATGACWHTPSPDCHTDVCGSHADCGRDRFCESASGTCAPIEGTAFHSGATEPQLIPDADSAGLSDSIIVSNPEDQPGGWAVTRLFVRVLATHPFRSDLEITLAHNGDPVALHRLTSPDASDGVDALFGVDPPADAIGFASDLETGLAAGDWTLTLRDLVPGDEGELHHWALYIQGTECTSQEDCGGGGGPSTGCDPDVEPGCDEGCSGPHAFSAGDQQCGSDEACVGGIGGGAGTCSPICPDCGISGSGALQEPIPNNTGSCLVLQLPVETGLEQVEEVMLRLDLEHEVLSELDVFLSSPSGHTIQVLDNIGELSSGTSSTWSSVAAFQSGSAPAEPLCGFRGLAPDGTWELSICDHHDGPAGALKAASLFVAGTDEHSVAGRSCKDAVDVSWSDNVAEISGDTRCTRDNAAGGCGGGSAGENVFRLFANTTARVEVEVTAADFDHVLYLRPGGGSSCSAGGSSVCTDAHAGSSGEVLVADLGPGYHYLFVDGAPGERGAFEATLRRSFLNPDGLSCSADSQCLSGFCVDAVCCRTACDGICRSCNKPGRAGVCIFYPAWNDPERECGPCMICGEAGSCVPATTGTDPKGDCAQRDPSFDPKCSFDGQCDGAGACRTWPAGTPCGRPWCTGDTTYRSSPECDVAGSCVPRPERSCEPYSCVGGHGACRSDCTADWHCAPMYRCAAGACEPAL